MKKITSEEINEFVSKPLFDEKIILNKDSSLPKISIVTPSYNQGKFLERTMLSVLNQNYPNLEYIIIDGKSTDDSTKVIKKYEKFLTFWVSEEDEGQSHAINKGLNRAKGEIVAYLNSDDIYLPGALEKVADFFKNNPKIDIVYGDCYIINEHGGLVKKKKEIDFDYLMGCMIGFGIIIIQPSTFMRKSVIEKVGYFNEELHFAMDAEYWFRCAKRRMTFKHIPNFLSGFRWHEESKTISSSDSIALVRYKEKIELLEQTYNEVFLSRIIPFKFSRPIRNLYRLKRIFHKLAKGCYR